MRLEEAAAAALAAMLPSPGDGTLPADQRLREFFRRHPALGKRDRLQIADWAFDVLRNLRLYREVACRERFAGSTAPDETRELIDVARAVAGVSDHDRIAHMAGQLPAAIRFSLPDWLWERLEAAHGERAEAIAQALLQPSPIDLRANLLVGKA